MEKGKQLAFRKNDSCRFVSVLLQEWDVEGRENTSAGLKLRLFFLFFFFGGTRAIHQFTAFLASTSTICNSASLFSLCYNSTICLSQVHEVIATIFFFSSSTISVLL